MAKFKTDILTGKKPASTKGTKTWETALGKGPAPKRPKGSMTTLAPQRRTPKK